MMKKLILSVFSLVGLVMVLGAATAYTQTQYRAHIPFDFSTRDGEFKAGDYSVGPASGSINYSAIAITNRENGKASFLRGTIMGADNNRVSKGKLVFAVSDGQYALTDIQTPNWNMKMKRTVTRVKQLVKGKAAPKETIVAVNMY